MLVISSNCSCRGPVQCPHTGQTDKSHKKIIFLWSSSFLTIYNHIVSLLVTFPTVKRNKHNISSKRVVWSPQKTSTANLQQNKNTRDTLHSSFFCPDYKFTRAKIEEQNPTSKNRKKLQHFHNREASETKRDKSSYPIA